MKVRLPIILLVQCLVIIAAFTAVLVLLIRHQHAVFDDMSKELVATSHRSGQEAVLSFFRQRRAMMERSANQMKTLLSVTSCNSSTSCSGELETEATCYPDAMLCPLPEPNVNLTTLRNFFLQSIPLIEGDSSADSVLLLQHTSATFDDANTASDGLMLMDKYLQKDSYWFRANFVALTSSWTALHLNRGNLSTFEQPKSNWTLSITTQRSVGNTSSYHVDFPFPLLNINNRWIWGSPKASLYHYASDIERNEQLFNSDSYSLPLMIPIVRSPTNKNLSTTILGAHFKVAKLHSLLKNLIQNRTDASIAVLVWTDSRFWLSTNVASEGQAQLIGAGTNPEEIDIYSRAVGRCSSDANCTQVVYFDSASGKYCGISAIATDVEEGGLAPELHLLLCSDQNVYSKRLSLAQQLSLIIGVVGAIVCLGLAFLFLYLILSPLKNVEKAVELVSSMHTDEAAETAFKGINAALTLSEVSSVFLAVGCLSAKLNELKVFIPQALLIEEEGFDDEEEESMKVVNHQGSPEDQVYTFVSAKINDTNSHSTGNHDGTSDEEQARHETFNSDSQQAKQNTGFGFWWLFKRGRGSRSQPGNGAQPPLQKPQQHPGPVLPTSPLAQQRINRNAPSPGVEQAPEADFDEGDLSFTNSRNSSSYRLHRTASIPRSPAGGQLPLKTSNLNNLNASLFAIGGSQGRDTKIMATPSDHILQQSNNLADFNNNSMSLFSASGKAVANPFLKMTGPTVVHSTRNGTQLHPLSSTNHGKAHSNFASFSISQQMNPLVGASDLEQSPSTMNSGIHTPKLRSESVEPDSNVSASTNPLSSSHFMGIHKNKNPTVQHREASHAAAHQQPLGLSVGLSMSNFSPTQLKFRRAAVAYINIRNFHELITTRPDAYQIHKIYATIIEEHVNKARGVVDNIHGDQFAITFNVARSLQGINAAAKAAAGSMLDIVNAISNQKHILPESRHSLAIGVASGKALVAQVGSDHIKKLSTIGPLYNEAVLLSKIAKYVGQHIAITASTSAELEYDAYTALLGMVQIPNAPNLTDGALANNNPADVVLGANVVKPPKEVPLFSIMERARPIIGGNEWLYEVNEWTSLNPYAKLNEVMETYLLPEQSGGGVAAAAIKFNSLTDKNKFASDALFPVVLPPSVEAPLSENQSPIVPQTNTSTASSNGQRNPSHMEFADAMHVNTNSNEGTLFAKIKSAEASGIPSPSNSNPPSSGYESGAFANSLIYNKANKTKQNAAGGQNSHEAFTEQAIEVLPSTTPPNSAEWLQNRICGLLSAGGNHARYTTCQYTRRI